jgi:primosomal protein DnaI
VNPAFEYHHTPYLFYIPKAFHHCTLNNFDFTGQKNLIKIIRGFVEGDIKGLYLHGGFGVGKTHLLVSLYRIMVAKDEDVTDIFFTSLEAVIKELQNRMDVKEKEKTTNDYVDFLCEVGLLFLDDITAANLQNPWTSEILRKIINGRYENELRICFSANAGLSELKESGLHPHAISRITSLCEVVHVLGKDRRGKR